MSWIENCFNPYKIDIFFIVVLLIISDTLVNFLAIPCTVNGSVELFKMKDLSLDSICLNCALPYDQ